MKSLIKFSISCLLFLSAVSVSAQNDMRYEFLYFGIGIVVFGVGYVLERIG